MKNTNNEKEKLKEFVKRVEDRTNDVLDDSLMDDDANSENINVDYTDIVKNSAKAKISKLPWLIAIFLIFIIAIILGFMFFSNNPKTLFTQTVDGLFAYLEENVNDNVYDITDGNISLDSNIKSTDENSELYNNLSKVSFSADYVKDSASDKNYIDLKTTYDGDDFVSAKVYGDGDNTYIYSPIVSDNYFRLSSNKLSYFTDGNDIKIILKGVNQAIDKVIADEKVYGSKENLDVDGEVIRSYRTKFVIDKNNRNRVLETFINTLKANDEFVSVLANMKMVKNTDIRKSLDNYMSKLEDKLKLCNKLEISLYINDKTNEFIKAEALSELGNISFDRKEENKFIYTISNKNDGTLSNGEFVFNVNDNKTKYTYNLYYKQTKNNKVLFESNIDLKYTSKKADNFADVDVSNSVDIDKVGELEKLAIYTKIMATPNLSQFLPIIKEII